MAAVGEKSEVLVHFDFITDIPILYLLCDRNRVFMNLKIIQFVFLTFLVYRKSNLSDVEFALVFFVQ